MNIVNKLEQIKAEEAKLQKEHTEYLEEIKGLLRQYFGSDNGVKVGNFLCKESGINRLKKSLDPYEMAFDRGKEYMYMLIKAMLTSEQIAEIEKNRR